MPLEISDAYHYDAEVISDMRQKEWDTMPCATDMDRQPEISWGLRTKVILIMMKLHVILGLRLETLHLAVNIMDRYTSLTPHVQRSIYRLLGFTSMLVATKFDDVQQCVPPISYMITLAGGRYQRTDFVSMEQKILIALEWSLNHPTAEAWYRYMSTFGGNQEHPLIQDIARLLMEITLICRDFVDYRPSQVALGALSLSRYLSTGVRPSAGSMDSREVMEMLEFSLINYRNEIPPLIIRRHREAAEFIFDFYNATTGPSSP